MTYSPLLRPLSAIDLAPTYLCEALFLPWQYAAQAAITTPGVLTKSLLRFPQRENDSSLAGGRSAD